MVIASVLGISLLSCSQVQVKDSAQISVLRQMRSVLADQKYTSFYEVYCHPHVQSQLTSTQFEEWMVSEKGTSLLRLYDEVLAANDENSPEREMVAQPEKEDGKYEFILPKVRDSNTLAEQNRFWHIELQLDDGSWKLMDLD